MSEREREGINNEQEVPRLPRYFSFFLLELNAFARRRVVVVVWHSFNCLLSVLEDVEKNINKIKKEKKRIRELKGDSWN